MPGTTYADPRSAVRVQQYLPGGLSPLPTSAPRAVEMSLWGDRRPAPVIHRGSDAIYVDADGWALGLVSQRASKVPCAMVLARDTLGSFGWAQAAHIGDGRLWLDRQPFAVNRLTNAQAPRLTSPAVTSVIATQLGATACEEMRDLLAPGDLLRSLLAHVGHGSGLTPLVDDVLAGYLATAVAQGDRRGLVDVRDRTTGLSATLVKCASQGDVLPEFADFLKALNAGDEEHQAVTATRLAHIGHTSGSGLLLGALLRLGPYISAIDLADC